LPVKNHGGKAEIPAKSNALTDISVCKAQSSDASEIYQVKTTSIFAPLSFGFALSCSFTST
jgi:hypothetical protein